MIPFGGSAAAGAAAGLDVFLRNVFPSLFPFFVCAHYLIGSGLLHKAIPGKKALSYPLLCLTAAICGTPSAALICSELYKRGSCGRTEASLLCAALNQTGPLFIAVTLSLRFAGDRSVAPLFAVSHYLPPLAASVIIGAVYSRHAALPLTLKNSLGRSPLSLFSDSISAAVSSILRVGGTIVFFRTAHAVFESTVGKAIRSPAVCAFLTGLLEMTNGTALLFECKASHAEVLSAFLLSFGGVCVFIQTKMIFDELRGEVYLISKAVSGIVSAVLFAAVRVLFSQSSPVFKDVSGSLSGAGLADTWARAASVFAFCLTSLLALAVSAIATKSAASVLRKKKLCLSKYLLHCK